MFWSAMMRKCFRRPVRSKPRKITLSDPAQVAGLAAQWGVNVATVCRAVATVGPELEAVRTWIESRRSAPPNRSDIRVPNRVAS